MARLAVCWLKEDANEKQLGLLLAPTGCDHFEHQKRTFYFELGSGVGLFAGMPAYSIGEDMKYVRAFLSLLAMADAFIAGVELDGAHYGTALSASLCCLILLAMHITTIGEA